VETTGEQKQSSPPLSGNTTLTHFTWSPSLSYYTSQQVAFPQAPSRTALVWESRRLAKAPDSISMTSVELCFAPLRSSCSGTISPHPSFTSLSACIAYILTFSPIMRHQRKCHHVLYVIFSCVTFEKCHFIFSDCKLNCLYVTQTLR